MSLLWRDTGKSLRFLGVDARAAVGLIVFLIHFSKITLMIAFIFMLTFFLLERFDYTVPNALRKIRVMLSGRRKYAKNPIHIKKLRSR